MFYSRGGTVAQQVVFAPHSSRFLGSVLSSGYILSKISLHVLPFFMWVPSGFYGFLPFPKKIPVGGLVMDWCPIHGASQFIPSISRIGSGSSETLTWKWKGEWICEGRRRDRVRMAEVAMDSVFKILVTQVFKVLDCVINGFKSCINVNMIFTNQINKGQF